MDPSVAKGLSEQFTATGTYSDGSTASLTNQVAWTSGTTSVATISSTGLALTLATGMTDITASFGGVTSTSDTLTVTTAVLASIAVAPVHPSVAVGLTEQFSAMGTYTDGTTADVSSQVTWVSGTTSVATISSTGLASTLAVGMTDVSASSRRRHQHERYAYGYHGGGSPRSPWPPSIRRSPRASPSKFSAIGSYTDGSTADISTQVTWASGTTSVATISSTGLASTLATGMTDITASLGGVTSTSDTLTVTAAALT